jgi:hypothetical protein
MVCIDACAFGPRRGGGEVEWGRIWAELTGGSPASVDAT